MSNQVYIDRCGFLTRAAHIVEGRVQQLDYQVTNQELAVGDIYLGKVRRVMPALQAAFIDLGQKVNGFLHARDALPISNLPLEQRLREGQKLLLQVKQAARGTKGPGLSMDLSFASTHLVYLPTAEQNDVVISKASDNSDDTKALREQLLHYLQVKQLPGRIILRRACADQSLGLDVDRLIAPLRHRWQRVQSLVKETTRPGRLLSAPGLVRRTFESIDPANTEIWLDSGLAVDSALLTSPPTKQPSANQARRFRNQIAEAEQQALSPELNLPGGGRLVFNQTEAMTVVDVNSASAVHHDEANHLTNIEAAQEIARQLRLRNLGGIVVVDFINSTDAAEQAAVLQELQHSTRADRQVTTISEFSELGLIEIARRHAEAPLSSLFTQSCSCCHGQGWVRSVRGVSQQIFFELHNQQSEVRNLIISAAPQVIDALREDYRIDLDALSSQSEVHVELAADSSKSVEEYNIALG